VTDGKQDYYYPYNLESGVHLTPGYKRITPEAGFMTGFWCSFSLRHMIILSRAFLATPFWKVTPFWRKRGKGGALVISR
jgi:hypothetical protein